MNYCRLETTERGRHNNLNLIRFVLASSVILSHSYAILDQFSREPWARFSRSGASLGDIAVLGFFFLSGYLISKSAIRHPDPTAFLTARVLRIFPGLFAAITLTVFIIGPLFTAMSLPDYFHARATYHYLLNVILSHGAGLALPGLFQTNTITEANLPLWTLSSEWTMYVVALVTCLAIRGRSTWAQLRPSSWLALAAGLAVTAQMFPLPWMYSARWAAAFVLGAAIYFLRRFVVLSIPIAFAGFALSLGLIPIAPHVGKPMFFVALFYLLVVVGFHPRLFWGGFLKLGDFSYGLYIYAWPIQQILARRFHSPVGLFLASYMVVLPVAGLSWHLIESRSLKLKRSVNGPAEMAGRQPEQMAQVEV